MEMQTKHAEAVTTLARELQGRRIANLSELGANETAAAIMIWKDTAPNSPRQSGQDFFWAYGSKELATQFIKDALAAFAERRPSTDWHFNGQVIESPAATITIGDGAAKSFDNMSLAEVLNLEEEHGAQLSLTSGHR